MGGSCIPRAGFVICTESAQGSVTARGSVQILHADTGAFHSTVDAVIVASSVIASVRGLEQVLAPSGVAYRRIAD